MQSLGSVPSVNLPTSMPCFSDMYLTASSQVLTSSFFVPFVVVSDNVLASFANSSPNSALISWNSFSLIILSLRYLVVSSLVFCVSDIPPLFLSSSTNAFLINSAPFTFVILLSFFLPLFLFTAHGNTNFMYCNELLS